MSIAGKHAHPAIVGNDWLMIVEVYSFYASYKGNAWFMGVANTGSSLITGFITLNSMQPLNKWESVE